MSALLQLSILALTFAASTQAYSQFEPKCTTPNKTVNYVGSPDTRGTFDLLWSCLLTIVACTWSLQYLNVPEQREDLDPGWKRHIKWSVRTMWPKLKWSFITVIAPEVTLGKAFGNQLADRQVRRGWSQLAAEDGVPGSLLHASYANMGGFWLEIVGQPENTIDLQEFYSSPQGQLPRHFLLSGQDIIQLRIKRIIPRLPSISREEIMERDRGSGESFALSTAGGQILWITIQITARRARGLTVSQLEIAVIAFSACAIATYIANWNRPKQILRPVAIRIEIPVSSFDKKVTEIQAALNEARSQRGRSLFDEIIPSALRGNKELADIPDGYAGLGFLYMGIAGAVLFGGIHLAAWNFHFPTNIELIGWRVASLYTTVSLPALLLVMVAAVYQLFRIKEEGGILNDWQERFSKALGSFLDKAASTGLKGVIYIGIILYVVARLFILVEIFRSLCFLPPDAWVATFAADIPHIG